MPHGFHRSTNHQHATQQNGKHHFCQAQHHRLSRYGIEDCLQSGRLKENAYSDHFEEECFEYQNFTNRRHLKPGSVPTNFVFTKCPTFRRILERCKPSTSTEMYNKLHVSTKNIIEGNVTSGDISGSFYRAYKNDARRYGEDTTPPLFWVPSHVGFRPSFAIHSEQKRTLAVARHPILFSFGEESLD
ncbi:hypothetical protein TNCV_1482091 [Trichonephila clavipes]|nr:hypothetical protein TNCV_1482091 [Trichonephila clavipes]